MTRPGRPRNARGASRTAKATSAKASAAKMMMADYAMSFEQLGRWMDKRANSTTLRPAQATSLAMLDGAVSAVVAGPVSMMPEEWVCPMLGVDADDFNHDTETFSAIAATLMRHNAISDTLSTKSASFEPLHARTPDGEIDARSWCMGFYAVVKLRLMDWSRMLAPGVIEQGLMLPILFHCTDAAGQPVLPPSLRGSNTPAFAKTAWRDIPLMVEAMRQFWMPIRFKPGS
jgi:uncharacterized protein